MNNKCCCNNVGEQKCCCNNSVKCCTSDCHKVCCIVGPKGQMGRTGPVGPMGPMGPQGPVGPAGAIGQTGPQGSIGPQGPQGNMGPVGPQGPAGVPGSPATSDNILVTNTGIQNVINGANINLGVLQNLNGTSISFVAPDTITVGAGTYLIHYVALVTATTVTGRIGASIHLNGSLLPYATYYYNSETNPGVVVLQAIVSVGTSSTIRVQNNSGDVLSYENSNIIVVKLN